MTQALAYAAAGTLFTAAMTALGAAMVFFLQRRTSPLLHRCLVGFAAGVMIAASMWSLLIPAIERVEETGGIGWLPAAGGSAAGIIFLLAMDRLLPQFTADSFRLSPQPHSLRRVMMLVLAVLGEAALLTPSNLLLYELVWMIPGLLITEWTRTL